MMTALATVVGLMPMALKLGAGSEASAPLARAAVGGLAVSTVFTLFLVPALYEIFYGRHHEVIEMNRFDLPAHRLLVLIAALTGCSHPAEDCAAPIRLRTVVVIAPQRGTSSDSITLPGDLVGLYQSSLYAKVTGYLKSISVDKGDWVKEGQVLADDRSARAAAAARTSAGRSGSSATDLPAPRTGLEERSAADRAPGR